MQFSAMALIGGLVLLGGASDWFVLGAARLATRLRVSAVIVGAVIIGFGTSAPELLVSLLASLDGEPALAVGNVVGSNVANVTLVLGAAALAGPILVGSATIRREAPVSTAAVVLFGLAALAGLGPVAGFVLMAAMAASIAVVVRGARIERAVEDQELIAEVTAFEEGPANLPQTLLMVGAGLVGTLLGAHLVVSGGVDIASQLGLSEEFVGFTIVAVGTSLPELVTSVQAVRRGEDELIVGNVLGSNVFNSLAAGSIIAVTSGGIEVDDQLVRGVAVMVVSVVSVAVIMVVRRGFGRGVACALLLAYSGAVLLLAET